MKKFMKKYGFITLMLLGIIAGCVVGAQRLLNPSERCLST